jgi:hypothetical protein
MIGALAGKVDVVVGASSRSFRPGDMLLLDSGGQAVTSSFDLPKLTKSSLLLTAFRSPLPAQAALRREESKFQSLRTRGFIRTDSSVGLAKGEPFRRANDLPALTPQSVSMLAGGATVGTASYVLGGVFPTQHHGNNGLDGAVDPQPPGNSPINGGPGTGPGNPGNKGGAHPHP